MLVFIASNLSGTVNQDSKHPAWAGKRKLKAIWILRKQEIVSGSGISWAICKSTPRSRQITTPEPHHAVFYRLDALPTTQPTASKQWRQQTHNTRQDRITRRHCINHRPTNAHSNLCLKDNKSVNQFLKFRSGTIIIFRCYSVTCIYSYVNTYTHTHNRLTASVRVNPGRPVPEETLTHSHPTWSSESFIIFLH